MNPGRYARTLAHLRPAQVLHRARLRGQRAAFARTAALGRALAPAVPAGARWPAGFRPLPVDEEGGPVRPGRFRLLAEEHDVGPDWGAPGTSLLWRYHLHYFEWSAALDDPTFDEVFRSWSVANPVGRGVGWWPYPASLRAWVLCGRQTTLGRDHLARSLAEHAGFLRLHVEHDVGGNHLVKNAKALVGLGVLLDDDRLAAKGRKLLLDAAQRQVLPDGGHVERTPSYHAQVLGDLVDAAALLRAAGRPAEQLEAATSRMRDWLGAVLLPGGDVPLLNDCVPVPSSRLADLGVERAPRGPTLLLPSGIAVMPAGHMHLVADVGDPCPPDLPAHAHADTLTFELVVDGRSVIVDTGTSSYQDAAIRGLERSTAAHNVVEVDGSDSTEVWGAFRAGRRARPTIEEWSVEGRAVELVASHDGYRHLPGAPVHRRRFVVRPDSVDIEDQVAGSGRHRLTSRLHLAPGLDIERLDDRTVAAGPVVLRASHAVAVGTSPVAEGFGRRRDATVLVMDRTADLPATGGWHVGLREPVRH